MSKEIIPGPILARVTDVYDGDTFTVDVNVWPGVHMVTRVRCIGFDTPEIRSRNPKERALGRAARDYLRTLIGESVQLSEIRNDKYGGRVGAVVTLMGGQPLAENMIAAGHARPYKGGRRRRWG